MIQVTVTDGNCNDITDIFVMVVTSFAPTFENDTYVTSVPENSEAGKSVIKVMYNFSLAAFALRFN